ncbi:hypothetical protein [Nonomuraea typhae]|uniref:hypothetical protein n=1 Tax=Nonomuraea typhae TaxID=2603600 RepID=UPI0012F81A7C|nr:hypothetical protein [Nonomuraea typhae]
MIRSDGRRNLIAEARVMMWRASRPEVNPAVLVSRPTNKVIMERTGLKKTASQRWRTFMRELGFLGTVTEGSTPGTRSGGQHDGADNLAAEYVLLVPLAPELPRLQPVDAPEAATGVRQERAAETGPETVIHSPAAPTSVEGSRPPSVDLSIERSTDRELPVVRAHASQRGNSPAVAGRADNRSRKIGRADVTALRWPLNVTPGTRAEMLLAAEALRATSGTLAKLSAKHLRSILREFFAAGWSPYDVKHALDNRADGSQWIHTELPRFVPGWLRHRLAAWRDDDGQVLPGRTQRLEAAHGVRRTQNTTLATLAEPADPPAADVTSHASAARAALAEASPNAAAAIAKQAIRSTRLYNVKTGGSDNPLPDVDHAQHGATEPFEVFRREVLEPLALSGNDVGTRGEHAERAWLQRVTIARQHDTTGR